jgi:2-polyprenyl-3-methyl-5-hydroxy-6-metoxy-1,4-benzoquinol methylase
MYSLEINPHLAALARKRFGLANVVTSFDELPGGQYDLIYANQVLEHIYNPMELLHGPIAQRLKAGGCMVFSVPNYGSLNRALLGSRWIGYSPDEHIWFFTADSVRRLFATSPTYTVERTLVKSAVNTRCDRFRPNGAVKLAYYQTVMRIFEYAGRGDQLIVVLRGRASVVSKAAAD